MAKAQKGFRGNSPFTHRDDASAPIHTTHEGHFEALHYGAEVNENAGEIILGPPAFGSPDPRTLGHRMNPGADTPASAPKLDRDFEDLQRSAEGFVSVDEDELNSMTKPELIALAEKVGAEVPSGATKAEVIEAITSSEDVEVDDYDEDDDDSDDSDDSSS